MIGVDCFQHFCFGFERFFMDIAKLSQNPSSNRLHFSSSPTMEVYFSAADQLYINIVDSVSISKQCQYKLASHQIVDSILKLS